MTTWLPLLVAVLPPVIHQAGEYLRARHASAARVAALEARVDALEAAGGNVSRRDPAGVEGGP